MFIKIRDIVTMTVWVQVVADSQTTWMTSGMTVYLLAVVETILQGSRKYHIVCILSHTFSDASHQYSWTVRQCLITWCSSGMLREEHIPFPSICTSMVPTFFSSHLTHRLVIQTSLASHLRSRLTQCDIGNNHTYILIS